MEHSNGPTEQNRPDGIRPLPFIGALVAALIIGGVIGYGLGWLQATQNPSIVVVTATPNPEAVANQPATPPPAQSDPSSAAGSESNSNDSSPTPTIMEFLLSDARHFQGQANAPVTIIEFSDFK
ncbi:MAG: hypothetical protein JXM69_05415 [Anaerolineae bacterium]|nr:hypothetical protein [Anaerolineae bacterium]